MYTLDTNALIYYVKDDPAAVPTLQDIFSQNAPIYISAITEIELFGFADLTVREEQLIESALRTVSIISLDSRLARIAGFMRQTYRLKLGDSAIAATALFTGSTLVTRNVKDFRRIPNILLRKI